MTNLLRLDILKTSNKKYGVKRGSYEIIRILLLKFFFVIYVLFIVPLVWNLAIIDIRIISLKHLPSYFIF